MATPMLCSVVLGISALKLLLIPAYRSTDFEVHRNWLAITHSKPVSRWYYENTSEWTLDYPPLFAWFEYGLSHVAEHFDPEMLDTTNINYASEMTIIFQRLSVIVSDIVLAVAVHECSHVVSGSWYKSNDDVWADSRFIFSLLVLGNAGLLMIDHIHFQYNGFLLGFLLLSVAKILKRQYLWGALWFAILLNLKHIFLYVAPAYFVYLLRSYCFQPSREFKLGSFSVTNLFKLAAVVGGVFAVAWGPFIYMGQWEQVLSRLFPFKRGLSHAYWAPNFWALYNALDKVVAYIVPGVSEGVASMTGGLVREYKHAVLPSVAPLVTIILTLLSILPSLYLLWTRPGNPWEFVRSLVLCAFGSFLFGWHVHEKAILLVVIPLTLLAMVRAEYAQIFLLLSTTANFSFFPLFIRPTESPTKVMMLLLYGTFSFFGFALVHGWKAMQNNRLPMLNTGETLYLLGLVPLWVFTSIYDLLWFGSRLPFLPLMLTSVYCAVGVIYSWARFYRQTLDKSAPTSSAR